MRLSIGGLAAAVLLLFCPLGTQAQPAPKVHRIGIVSPLDASPKPPTVRAWRKGMRDLGYVEGKNVVLEIRYAEGRIGITIPRPMLLRADRVIE